MTSVESFIEDLASSTDADFASVKEFPLMPEGEAVDMGMHKTARHCWTHVYLIRLNSSGTLTRITAFFVITIRCSTTSFTTAIG